MTPIHFQSASELAGSVRQRKIGCLELLEHFLARVERFNPRLNAIVCTDFAGARERAKAADAALARGEVWGPLHGVPMTVKESFNVAGLPTTWGHPPLKDNIAHADASAVTRLKAAGAIVFGKTNVPINLADWQTFNAVYGTTNNPWNLKLVPGGSSGGAAAVLAAGLAALEAGSDIGASIRNPAHYCGVYGHKPTHTIVSPRGHALPGALAAADMSVVGPLGRSADDLELALDIMAGPDEFDSAGWKLALPPPRRATLKGLRVAVMYDHPKADVDAEYREKLEQMTATLARAGATVSETERPEIDFARFHEVYILLVRAATSGRLPDEQIARFVRQRDSLAPGDTLYPALMARGNTLSHREWIRLNNERTAFRFKWAEFFKDWDVMLCPAAASAAWPHDHKGERHERTIVVNGNPVPSTDQMFWAGISSLVYLPATVAPIGLTRSGLPVGVQIVAAHLDDRTAIEVAKMLAREIGGFIPPPGFD
ncbi:MAG: amidase [Rhodospirillales bacterium]|nr:amidase [Rhodospirillales bacterium]